jgi:hypothetical protein
MRAFNCSRSAVHSALTNGLSPPKSRGRHVAVDAESDLDILAWIKKQAEKNAAVTRTDIKKYCHEVCRLEVSRGWVDSFILHPSAELKEKKSSRQEKPRLQVPRIFLGETIRSMHEAFHSCPADLVINLDEVGISDWEDRKPKKFVVPITLAAHDIHDRISRNVKHISIVTCISAGSACFTAYVVTSQDSAALHRALEATEMQIGKHFILKKRTKPYVNTDLFENYVRTVFLPHLAITRIMQNVRNEEAVRLMDNCSLHLTPIVIDLPSEARVRIVTFAPHTTQIFQVLDLSLFGVLKRRGQDQLRFGDDARSARFIKKGESRFSIDHDQHQYMERRAFRGIGLIYNIVGGIRRVLFDEIILCESGGFRKLWDFILTSLYRICRRGAKMRGWDGSVGLNKVVCHLNLSVLPAHARDIFT